MNTRPWIPSWLSARSRPVFASALKPRSLSPPMSVTSATRMSEDCACPPLSSLPPPQARAASASSATSASPRARRVRRDPIEGLHPRPEGAVKRGGRAREPAHRNHGLACSLLDGGGRLDLAGRELLRPGVELGDQGGALRCRGAHLAVADAAVLRVVDTVDPALPLRAAGELDRVVDPHVDLLQGAREDLLAEVELVGVDADAPVLVVLRRLDGAEAAATRD